MTSWCLVTTQPRSAKPFFPSNSEFAEVLLALATFGAGFLMRPLGAVVLGAYIDRKGRRTGLLLNTRVDVDRDAVHRVCAGI